MLQGLRPISLSLSFFGCVVLLFCPVLQAQQNCNVEVKILLSPAETQAAVAALGAKKETFGRIYFFDTVALDLLSQGAIMRLRRGVRNDFTIKWRTLSGNKLSAPSQGSECEIDLTSAGENYSYSVTRPFDAKQLPGTGYEVSRLLFAGQLEILKWAQISVDWAHVKRIAEITSTYWQIRAQPPFRKLTLELWKWPGGEILELSTKVPLDAAASTYSGLRQLVKTKQLSMSPDQRPKTTIALEAITVKNVR
jgi:hypothetical protein